MGFQEKGNTETTWVEHDICVCNNCGAFADSPQNIKHHKTCTPGESKRWENTYSHEKKEETMGFNDDWYPDPYWEEDPEEDPEQNAGPEWTDDPEWGVDPDWAESQKEVELVFDILVHTTEKAYLLQFDEQNVWFAKSQATLNMSMHKNIVLVPMWLVEEKELEDYLVNDTT